MGISTLSRPGATFETDCGVSIQSSSAENVVRVSMRWRDAGSGEMNSSNTEEGSPVKPVILISGGVKLPKSASPANQLVVRVAARLMARRVRPAAGAGTKAVPPGQSPTEEASAALPTFAAGPYFIPVIIEAAERKFASRYNQMSLSVALRPETTNTFDSPGPKVMLTGIDVK